MDKWRTIAEENGISYNTYLIRINRLGWTKSKAATKPLQQGRSDTKWIKIAKSNGIKRTTYISRVDRHGWSPQKAATTALERRTDAQWVKLARQNGINRSTYNRRVDEMFWDPKDAATIIPMTKKEVLKNANKYRKEYWKTKQELAFNDKNNLYTITPQHIKIALNNGIDRGRVEARVYILGWTVQEAISKPLQNRFIDKPAEYDEYRKRALENGINGDTFYKRVKAGWSLEEAIKKEPNYINGRADKQWMQRAKKNGINIRTYIARVDRMGWTYEEASTIPALPKGEYLNEETREKAREGHKVFRGVRR